MKYSVICPDGKDRLLWNYDTFEDAKNESKYFNVLPYFGCLSWANQNAEREHGCCPGGEHFVDGNIVFVEP